MNIFEYIKNIGSSAKQSLYGDIGKEQTDDEMFKEHLSNLKVELDLNDDQVEDYISFHENDKNRLIGVYKQSKKNINEQYYHTEMKQIL